MLYRLSQDSKYPWSGPAVEIPRRPVTEWWNGSNSWPEGTDDDDWNDDDDEHDGDPDPFGFKFGKTTSRPVAMCDFDAAFKEPDYQP